MCGTGADEVAGGAEDEGDGEGRDAGQGGVREVGVGGVTGVECSPRQDGTSTTDIPENEVIGNPTKQRPEHDHPTPTQPTTPVRHECGESDPDEIVENDARRIVPQERIKHTLEDHPRRSDNLPKQRREHERRHRKQDRDSTQPPKPYRHWWMARRTVSRASSRSVLHKEYACAWKHVVVVSLWRAFPHEAIRGGRLVNDPHVADAPYIHSPERELRRVRQVECGRRRAGIHRRVQNIPDGERRC